MNPRDRKAYRKCLDCDNMVLPPRRKCNSCRKSVVYNTVTLNPSTRGRNKRGTCLSKPDKIRTKRPKRQNPDVLGSTPYLRMSKL